LKSRDDESKAALQAAENVRRELQIFQSTLNSETILTDPELDRIRQFESTLQPSRPERLRMRQERPANDIHMDNNHTADQSFASTDGIGDAGAPSWEDMVGEQNFRSNPNFRTFSEMCRERKELWDCEAEWLKVQISKTNESTSSIASQKSKQEAQLRNVAEEEAGLLEDVKNLEDFDGHERRHSEAKEALREARDVLQQRSSDVAEAVVVLQEAETQLEHFESQKKEAEGRLATSQDAMRQQEASMRQIRAEMEGQTNDLEARCREYLQEWRTVELEEQKLKLLQVRVGERLNEEKEGRNQLRAEAKRLIEQLKELDSQLDVDFPQQD